MTLQNRVTPDGRIIATPARGTLTGNRGILHRPDKTLGPALWAHRAWVCCALKFKDHHRVPMAGRSWTELFFLDEAVALAAGHRPCGYCRRADFDRYRGAWAKAAGALPSAPEMDAALHTARAVAGARQMRHDRLPVGEISEGSFFDAGEGPTLLWRGLAHPYRPEGYDTPEPLPDGIVRVLTPAPSRAVLAQGYVPLLHPSLKPL